VVLTTNPSLDMPKNVLIAMGLQEAIYTAKAQAKTWHRKTLHKVFVISGEKVYDEVLLHLVCDLLHITCVYLPKGHQMDLQVDTFFPVIDKSMYKLEEWSKRHKSSNSNPSGIKFVFEHYSHRGSSVQ
jgi:dihydrofolate reductase